MIIRTHVSIPEPIEKEEKVLTSNVNEAVIKKEEKPNKAVKKRKATPVIQVIEEKTEHEEVVEETQELDEWLKENLSE